MKSKSANVKQTKENTHTHKKKKSTTVYETNAELK